MSKYDSIIFDLDGVLWDTCTACAVAWNNVLKRNNIKFREIIADDVRKVTGKSHEDCIKDTFIGLAKEQIDLIIQETIVEDTKMIAELGGSLYPKVTEGLKILSKEYPLFIVSNCQSGYIEFFLERNDLKSLFKDFECWGDTKQPKAKNIAEIIKRNNLKSPIYIGDTDSDRKAAEANNIPFIFVSYGFGLAEHWNVKADSFSEVSSYFLDHQKFQIRKAQQDDAQSIAKIHIQAWQETYQSLVPQDYLDNLPNELHGRVENWRKSLANPNRNTWVASIEDQIVGFVLFGPPRDKNKEGYIELGAIYLLKKYKNLGVGRSLLLTGLNFMSSLGYQKAYCWCLEGNPTSKFYEKSGAIFSGETKFDEIGGKQLRELAYEWANLNCNQADYYFDENLRDIPTHPEQLKKYVEKLNLDIKSKDSPKDQVRIMGEMGVYLRQLMQLDEAEQILSKALELIETHCLGLKFETQQKIRLAHVYQWNKKFIDSNRLFSEVVQSCRNNPELSGYLAFALQHAGKNLFDQGKFADALSCFEEALQIRVQNNVPKDQIESTQLAIQVTKDRLSLK